MFKKHRGKVSRFGSSPNLSSHLKRSGSPPNSFSLGKPAQVPTSPLYVQKVDNKPVHHLEDDVIEYSRDSESTSDGCPEPSISLNSVNSSKLLRSAHMQRRCSDGALFGDNAECPGLIYTLWKRRSTLNNRSVKSSQGNACDEEGEGKVNPVFVQRLGPPGSGVLQMNAPNRIHDWGNSNGSSRDNAPDNEKEKSVPTGLDPFYVCFFFLLLKLFLDLI